jgi:hypothetical protein
MKIGENMLELVKLSEVEEMELNLYSPPVWP